MNETSAMELRSYLLQQRRKSGQVAIPVFDDFLKDVEAVFRLRVFGEGNYRDCRAVAHNPRGALPITWSQIDAVLNPQADVAEESLIADVARKCVNEAESLWHDMRKVLSREREKVPVGNVQQMDAQCLRWLVRQPGRTPVEKAGVRQRMQAIVRRENYDTLENRVLKDFFRRAEALANLYGRRNRRFRESQTVKQVVRLMHIARAALESSVMDSVAELHGLPMPNYVLRQDRRYSRIWKQYCRIVRWAEVTLRLWNRRDELAGQLRTLRDHVPLHVDRRAKYQSLIWVNEVDGRKPFLDNPFYWNEIGEFAIRVLESSPRRETVVVDLVGAGQEADVLVYSRRHANAKPYLQNFAHPNREDVPDGEFHFLHDLLRAQDVVRLRDYFEQIRARSGGERWIVLVPDDWDALWQEKVIRAIPLERSRVFLLWRSVAVALGAIIRDPARVRARASVTVHDFQASGNFIRSRFELDWDESHTRKIPRRRAYRRAPENYAFKSGASSPMTDYEKIKGRWECVAPRFDFSDEERGDLSVVCGLFSSRTTSQLEAFHPQVVVDDLLRGDSLAREGALYFAEAQARGETAYYDELEALSIVGQNVDREAVAVYSLVEPDDKWPGGKVKEARVADAVYLKPASREIDFYLCMGEVRDWTRLKSLNVKTAEVYDEPRKLVLHSRIAPGQGMAVVTVNGLVKPVVLDYVNNMRDSGKTIAVLEREMPRSFPPESPGVAADDGMWWKVRDRVMRYAYAANDLFGGATRRAILKDGFADAFGFAHNVYTPATLPPGASPLLLLKRKNVFGNEPGARLPREYQKPSVFNDFFGRLARDYASAPDDNDLIRVIAWTYQHDNPVFSEIKKRVLKRLAEAVRSGMADAFKIMTQEYTLLANLCDSREEWDECLTYICLRLRMHGRENITNFARMLYNLLQFHPTILKDASDELCDALIHELVHWYGHFLDRNKPTTTTALLRCILYLLRRRRFDGKRFLKAGSPLRVELQRLLEVKLPKACRQEQLRQVVVEYLNGRGTIDGLLGVAE